MIETARNTNLDRVSNDEIDTTNNTATMITNKPSFLAYTRVIYGSLIELCIVTAETV